MKPKRLGNSSAKFVMVALAILSMAQGQKIKHKFRSRHEDGGVVWQVQGNIDLPRNSIIVMRWLWQKQEIKNSRRLVRLDANGFCYRFGPFRSNLPPGEYQLDISFYRELQQGAPGNWRRYPPFAKRFGYNYGSELERMQQQRYWQRFCGIFITKINEWHRNLTRQVNAYLAMPSPPPFGQIKMQLYRYRTQLQALHSSLRLWTPPRLLVVYCPTDAAYLRTLTYLSDFVWQHRYAELVARYIQGKEKQKIVGPSLRICRDQIDKALAALTERQPAPTLPGLQQDHQWAREIFTVIRGQLSAAPKKSYLATGKATAATLQEELKELATASQKYCGSKLANAHPTLPAQFVKLVQNLKQLLERSDPGSRTVDKPGAIDLGNLFGHIESQFAEIERIICHERQKLREHRQEYIDNFAKLANAARCLQQEMFKQINQAERQPLPVIEIGRLRSGWLRRVGEIDGQLKKWRADGFVSRHFAGMLLAGVDVTNTLRMVCEISFAALGAKQRDLRTDTIVRSRQYMTIKAINELTNQIARCQQD